MGLNYCVSLLLWGWIVVVLNLCGVDVYCCCSYVVLDFRGVECWRGCISVGFYFYGGWILAGFD